MSIGATGISRFLAAAMLVGVLAQSHLVQVEEPNVARYHARIRAADDGIPPTIGPWIGQNVPLPARALNSLHPNVLVSRTYINAENGTRAGLLMVHCTDAHHMVGHFPLRCYPAEGWNLVSSKQRDWKIGTLLLTGMEYEFTKQDVGGPFGADAHIIVDNCLLRPRGLVLRDMSSMSDSILGAEGQATGAGQIQVYFSPDVDQSSRDAAVLALVNGYRPVIDAILADPDDK
jgi:hypothetical protein